jgi:hypothetical protein
MHWEWSFGPRVCDYEKRVAMASLGIARSNEDIETE